MKTPALTATLALLDARLSALLPACSSAQPPARGWLRTIRTALGLSQPQVAGPLELTRQSLADLEAAEARGAISLGSLSRVAAVMDCELVYFLVPRDHSAISYHRQAPQSSPAPPSTTSAKPKITAVYLSDGELPTVLK
ncbi:MAG: hypothetical protein K9M98_00925 [Cephaloticoccus sp.]|nr:hypothetical protein [Cephaloticoccus sp.]MCF7759041.1 hypothetical protein [Cephaloticoccus sp.]